jgi:hypothetical protein
MFQNWEKNPAILFEVTVVAATTTITRDDTGRDVSLGYGLNELYSTSGEGLVDGRTGVLPTPAHLKFNDVTNTSIELRRGQLYVFDQSASSNRYYPLKFSVGTDGENKGFAPTTQGVTYWLDGEEVSFPDYSEKLNDNTAVSPEVRLLVSSTEFDTTSTPIQLRPYVKNKIGAGGTTQFAVILDNVLLPRAIVKPLSIIIVSDENFFGERPVEHRFSYREWFNTTVATVQKGLNFFEAYYYQGLVYLRAKHGTDHWHWSTSKLTTSNGMLSGTSTTTLDAAYAITTGGIYTFYAQAADSANRPVGDTYVATLEITPAEFLADKQCPETLPVDNDIRYRPTPQNITAPPVYDPVGDTTPLIDVLSVTFARPLRLTDGLNNLDSSGVAVHVIIVAHNITYWAYWLDDSSDNKIVVRETPQATFLMDRDFASRGAHTIHVCGYDSAGTKVAESSRRFQFNPKPLPVLADPTTPTDNDADRDIYNWYSSLGVQGTPKTIIWDDRYLGNFDPNVPNPRLGWLNWVRRSTTSTNVIASSGGPSVTSSTGGTTGSGGVTRSGGY